MLIRSKVDPATLAEARAVGIRPAALVRRCVALALRRAASSFWRGAYKPLPTIGAESATECRAGCRAGASSTPFFGGGAYKPLPTTEGRA